MAVATAVITTIGTTTTGDVTVQDTPPTIIIVTYIGNCEHCKRFKSLGPDYGELPAKNETAKPFEETAIDLMGPWKIPVNNVGNIVVHAQTMIDIASTLVEIKRIENKTSLHCATIFENEWLSRYPRPLRVLHDPGTEYTGAAFQSMLLRNGIQSVPTTAKNPQANAVIERVHLTIANMVRTELCDVPQNTVATAIEIVDRILASAQYAARVSIHRTMEISPGAMVFNRDMILPIPLIANYNLIREKKQIAIDEANRKENLRRRFKDYVVGDKVMIKAWNPGKLQARTFGPFIINQVHTNGTITIERKPNVYERINIRRVVPYDR